MEAKENGNYEAVERILRQVLLGNPRHAEALFILGSTQAARGDLSEAVQTLDSIPQDGSDAARAAIGQSADWLIQLGRYDEAEQRLRQFLAEFGDVAVAHRRLAQLLNNQGRRIEAAPHMRALARMGVATDLELYGMTRFSDPFIHKSVAADDVQVNPSELCMARVALYQGNLQEADERALALRVNDPSSTAVSAFCGRIIVARQDDAGFAKWIATRTAGIEREPEYWAALGTWYQDHDQHEIAIRCFLEAVNRDDTDRFSYLGLSRSLQVLGLAFQAKLAMERFEMLDRVAFIATEVKWTVAQMHEISELLLRLHRPAEARAWSELESKARGQATRQKPPQKALQREADADWVRCGMDLSKWPLPDLGVFDNGNPQPEIAASLTEGHIVLVDVAANVELQMQYQPGPPDTDLDDLLMHQTVGGGVAALDYDQDGSVDLYFTQSAGTPFQDAGIEPNQLFRNLQGKRFQKVTRDAGAGDSRYGQGVSVSDFNQDGFSDLFIANIGVNTLLINNGDGTFQRRSFGGSENGERWTTSIACGDLNGDCLPDVVEVNYIDDASVLGARCSKPNGDGQCNPHRFHPAVDRFLASTGDGTFEPLIGIGEISPSYGFGVIIGNIDNEFGNDVFIANDTDPNHYWQSHADEGVVGSFKLSERGQLLGCACGPSGDAESCMGVATGDFDRNARMDFHVTNYTDESSDLYLQHSSGIFTNQFIRYGLENSTRPVIGWGTQSADFDGDGWLDLVTLNGHLYSHFTDGTPYRMPPQLFRGSQSGFSETTIGADDDRFWATPGLGRTLASLDWNGDGKMDLVAYDIDAPAALLENRTAGGNWLQLELVGTLCERDAVGARIEIRCAGETWTAWVTSGDGFQCKNQAMVQVGLGGAKSIDEVKVFWPSGTAEIFRDIAPNRRYLVVQGEPNLFPR